MPASTLAIFGQNFSGEVLPMAGFGCGLPLTRTYLNWVGGDIDIVSLPMFGTDVYVNLNRIGDAEEKVLLGNQLPGHEGGWLVDQIEKERRRH